MKLRPGKSFSGIRGEDSLDDEFLHDPSSSIPVIEVILGRLADG